MNLFLMKYIAKRAMREKSSIFWTILFPLLLATIFGVVFKNINNSSDVIERTPIMVESPVYREILSEMKYKDKYLYDVKNYNNPEEALKEGKIKAFINGGIIADSDKIKSEIKKSGINVDVSKIEKNRYIDEKINLKEFDKSFNMDGLNENQLKEYFSGKYNSREKSLFLNEINLGNVNINIINQSKEIKILSEIVNSINQTSMTIGTIIENNYEIGKIDGEIGKIDGEIGKEDGEIGKVDGEIVKKDGEIGKIDGIKNISAAKPIKNVFGSEKKDSTVIFFFSLMAMICLGNMTFGITIIEDMNMESEFSHVIRTYISPILRDKIALNGMAVYWIFNTVVSMLLYTYMKYVIKVPFGGNVLYVFLTVVVANLMALFAGMFLAMVLKAKTSTKYSVAAGLYVLSCSLSGMMSVNLLGTFANQMQFINYINPATVITRMLLSLYITDSSQMYWKIFINLVAITVVFITLASVTYKRKMKNLKGGVN